MFDLRSTKPYSLAGIFILFLAFIFISACSTKKNTFIRRTYHNLTSHFNVYWNGMDNLRQGIKEFKASVKDNYSLVLPVYNFGDKSGAGKMSQFADASIKKASKTIQKHSMTFNRKEYVRWIDDSYMLIGKSYFYKQDYPMARRTFEFVIKTYNTEDIKYEAMFWQALSNIQLGDFGKAEPMLDMLLSKITKGEAPDKFETDVNLTYGQFFILQKNYDAAVPYLNRALELKPDHDTRSRVYFILGQINQKNGEFDEASRYYSMVIKRNPSYDMEFNAKINLAQCYNTKTGNRDFIVKKLTRMLKDDKNKDFQDQIYYSLAHVYLKDADTLSAIGFLKNSVSSSRANNYQKAISSLELADIFFEVPDYPMAQAYYDSTMQFLPKDYPNYKELQAKTNTLTDLVINLEIIRREDSLQSLALMPEAERMKIVDQLVSKVIAEEQKKKQEEQEKQENLNMFGQNPDQQVPGPGGVKEGRWYFYNPSTLSNGFSNFTRKWGRRKLEDNWFLSDKNMVSMASAEVPDTLANLPADTTKGGKKPIGKTSNPKDRNYYLQDIPFTPDQILASTDKIIQAYYNSGFIYVEGLNDLGRAIESFETLYQRFPENKYKVQTFYKLYQLFKILENKPKCDQYKNIILTQFPESDYAKLLINPNYYKEIVSKKSEVSNLYEDTYTAFSNQQYYMVLNNAGIAHANFKADTALIPKFDYLRALALGKIEVVDSMVVAMQQIIRDYPKSEVRPLAQNVLNFLGTQKNAQGEPIVIDSATLVANGPKLYSYDANAIHFYVMIVNGTLVDVDAQKIKISDFNLKNHDLENLQINSLMFDDYRQLITINSFESSEKAMNYLMSIRDSKYIFTKLENSGEYYDFVISAENYPILYRNKDISLYIRFFEKFYPVKK